MIKKFTSGNPIDTQAVVEKFNALPIAEFPLGGKFENGNFVFEFDMADSDIVYGLGEAPRGINKRGWVYNSFCSDDPFHTETKSSGGFPTIALIFIFFIPVLSVINLSTCLIKCSGLFLI